MAIPKAYEEIIEFIAAGTTPQHVIDFRASDAANARVAELLAKNRNSNLDKDEQAELDVYLSLEHIFRLAKAKAHLKLAAESVSLREDCE